jgi:anti-sigma factor (TIGR02949 family)
MNGDAGCATARANLDAFLSRELPDQTSREVQRHLEICPQCAAELETRARVRTQLQAAVRATPVPVGLEGNVRRAVRGAVQSGASRPRSGLWAVAAAAAVILCVALASRLRVQSNPEETILRKTSGRLAAVLNVGLRDHLHCAVFRKYSKQPVAGAQMAADLGPEFAGLVPLIQAKLPADFRVIQGHHCVAGGRQYTHLIIAGDGKIVSVVLTPRQPGESLNGGIHQAGVDRFQVVGFESHNYLAYVISDMDAQQNLRWAANLAPALREYLGAHTTG